MFVARAAIAIPVQLVTGTSTATATALSSTVSSLACNYSPGSASGDYLLMLVATNRNSAGSYTITTPSGWTAITAQNPSGASDGKNFSIFGRFRGAETSVTVSFSVSVVAFITIVAYQGGTVNAGSPVNISGSAYTNTSGTTLTCPSVTTTANGCSLALFGSAAQSSNTAFTDTWTAPPISLIDTVVSETNFGPVRWSETIATTTQAATTATGTFTATTSASTIGLFTATVALAHL